MFVHYASSLQIVLYSNIITLFLFISSIGDHYATLYLHASDMTGSPQSVEKRKDKAKLVLAGAKEMCKTILSKIFNCMNVPVLSRLLIALECFHKICSYYCQFISKTKIRKDRFFKAKYNPYYPPALQMDCFKYLAQLHDFCKDVTPFLEDRATHEHIIQIHRIALVISRYLQDFLMANPVFHATPPHYLRLRKKIRSNWQY